MSGHVGKLKNQRPNWREEGFPRAHLQSAGSMHEDPPNALYMPVALGGRRAASPRRLRPACARSSSRASSSQLPDGSFPGFDRRPPLEEGQMVGVAFAVGALRQYPQPLKVLDLERTFAKARGWLIAARI